jgi:hypothetical protein
MKPLRDIVICLNLPLGEHYHSLPSGRKIWILPSMTYKQEINQ